ncbi:MAG: M48 family metallopeptidase [Gammaproteobacteria bacterium]
MNGFTFVFLTFVLATSAVHLWLAGRQRLSALRHRQQVPEAFRGQIDSTVHEKAADYTAAKMRLEQVDVVIGARLVLAWTLGGGLNALAAAWDMSGWGAVAAGTGLVISALLVMALLDMPMDIYRTFVVEAKFGFNRTTPALYFSDTVKQGVISLLLGTPIIAILLWLVMHAGAWWWVYGWLIWTAFTLVMLWLYPTLIAPLFNRFTPLQDEALRERIVNLLKRCGFNNGGIFVMDGSKRSQHGNAYFTGFGTNKRIVFFDTLLKSLQPDEIEAVLAHELGHFKHGHVRKRFILITVTSLVAFAILGALVNAPWFYSGLGVRHPSYATALVLFLLIMPYFSAVMKPVSSYWMRKHEFEADDYAAAQTNARNLIHALVKLYQENAASLTPDSLYSAYHDSHPPAPIRISHLAAKSPAPAP